MDHGREAEGGDGDAGHLHQKVIPKKKDTTPGAICWTLCEATQPMPPQESSRELIDTVKLRFLEAHYMTGGGSDSSINCRPPVRTVKAPDIPAQKVYWL